MKPSILVYFGVALIIVLTGFSAAWLWFMIRRPEKWAAIVDKENDWWVRRGFVSASTAAKFKRFEKGMGQKVLVGGVTILGIICLFSIALLLIKLQGLDKFEKAPPRAVGKPTSSAP